MLALGGRNRRGGGGQVAESRVAWVSGHPVTNQAQPAGRRAAAAAEQGLVGEVPH